MRLRKDIMHKRIKLAAQVGNARVPGPCPYCGKYNRTFVDSVDSDTTAYAVQHHCPECNGLWTDFCHDDVDLPVIAVLYAIRKGLHRATS